MMKLPAGYVPGEGVYKATAYGGFGERLLKRMGWEEGRGLGTNQHGITSAIEVKKKEDQTGVRPSNNRDCIIVSLSNFHQATPVRLSSWLTDNMYPNAGRRQGWVRVGEEVV